MTIALAMLVEHAPAQGQDLTGLRFGERPETIVAAWGAIVAAPPTLYNGYKLARARHARMWVRVWGGVACVADLAGAVYLAVEDHPGHAVLVGATGALAGVLAAVVNLRERDDGAVVRLGSVYIVPGPSGAVFIGVASFF